jgi:transcriptional regulator with XRE-family HTH domain
MTPLARIRLQSTTLPAAIGELVRDTRLAIGWSQAELGARVGASQTTIWRIEHGDPGTIDLGTVQRVLASLGLRATLEVEGRHLADRADQRDRVHAALIAAIAGRLRRFGWMVETEVPTGAASPTGWIDALAYRERDAAMAIIEVKTDLPDVGGLQRQVTWYEREAPYAARRLGWHPASTNVIVICLSSAAVAARLREHRELLGPAFPGDPRTAERWLRDPGASPPAGRTLALTDLARRRDPALQPSGLHGRGIRPAYRDYAHAASILRARSAAR